MPKFPTLTTVNSQPSLHQAEDSIAQSSKSLAPETGLDSFSANPASKYKKLLVTSKSNSPPYQILEANDVKLVDYGPQFLTNETIGHVESDGKMIGYVQTHPSKHGPYARVISLLNKAGEIVGFGTPPNWLRNAQTHRLENSSLVDAPELIEGLQRGELNLGAEYFEVYNHRQFTKDSQIGLIRVPPEHERCREDFEESVLG